jgi:hypothetical protein
MSNYGASDTEDPEFDPVTGHLFVLSGTDREIFRIDPVDGIFGNGNDIVTSFDISHLGPTDFEGADVVGESAHVVRGCAQYRADLRDHP